jgi:hypothetical protein
MTLIELIVAFTILVLFDVDGRAAGAEQGLARKERAALCVARDPHGDRPL